MTPTDKLSELLAAGTRGMKQPPVEIIVLLADDILDDRECDPLLWIPGLEHDYMPEFCTSYTRTDIVDRLRADMPVRVKPLVWVDDNDICSTAQTSIGEYVVQEDYNIWRVWPCDWVDNTGEEYPDRPSAKAAAQADLDARIRAALEE